MIRVFDKIIALVKPHISPDILRELLILLGDADTESKREILALYPRRLEMSDPQWIIDLDMAYQSLKAKLIESEKDKETMFKILELAIAYHDACEILTVNLTVDAHNARDQAWQAFDKAVKKVRE